MDFNTLSDRWDLFSGKMAFSSTRRSNLYKMLAAMIRNGLPLNSGLEKLLKLYRPRKHPLTPVIARWHQGMADGKMFSEVIKDFVPNEELTLIVAGEHSNQVAEGMEQAQRSTAAKMSMRKAVIGALAQPALLVIMLFGLLMGFSIGMAPTLMNMFPLERFPSHVQKLFALAEFLKSFWWLVVGLMVTAVAGVSWSLGNWTGSLRERMENIPPWSMYRTYSSASFMIALSALLQAGVALPEAMRTIRAQSTPWMRKYLSISLNRLERGDNYQRVFGTGLLDQETYDQVAIYADMADFDQAIRSIGNAAIESSVESIKTKAAVTKTLSMVLMGAMIAWIYSAFMAVNQLSSELGKPGGGAPSGQMARP